MSRIGIFKLVLWLAAASPALAGWRIDGVAQGGWSIDGAVQGGGGGGGTGDLVFAESNRLWVDWRNDTGIEDGSLYRPYVTVQAAMDAIGGVDDMLDLTNAASRYTVHVAPGVYAGDVVVPYQRDIVIELDSALIEGDLAWTIYNAPDAGWLESEISDLIPRLTIAGRSWKPQQPGHANTGIAGSLTVDYGGAKSTIRARFGALNLLRVRADTVSLTNTPSAAWLLLSMSVAGVGTIYADPLVYGGISIYADGWDGGGYSSDNYGSRGGIGPLVGRVYPMSLHNILIAGMDIAGQKPAGPAFGSWNNVYFRPDSVEGADPYVINTDMPVKLDTATYNRWIAATEGTNSARGTWQVNGGLMTLTDPGAFGPWVSATDTPAAYKPLYIGQLLSITGTPKRVYHATGTGTNDWTTMWSE